MKTAFSMLLALLVFANMAKADQVLIYQGRQTDITDAKITSVEQYFYLFDMTTFQFNSVLYGTANKSKFFTVSSTSTAFVNEPVATPNNISETYFEFGANSYSSPVSLVLGSFVGYNTAINIGGEIIAQFPPKITFVYNSITGNKEEETIDASTRKATAGIAAIPEAAVNSIRGIYYLNVPLTQQSNNADDDLAGATTIVTTFLTSQGYGPPPP